MGMAISLRLSGGAWTLIKQPAKCSIERYNLTKPGRVTSGLMTMDLVAKKRKFLFEYPVISKVDFEAILDIIDTDEMFFELQYTENDVVKTATVYVGHIPSERFRTNMGWYWKNVNFNLIEQ